MSNHVSQFEPLLIGVGRPGYRGLIDMAESIIESSVRLETIVSASTAIGLSDLVAGMNCYYSNLIEGHHTQPADIDVVLRRDFSGDAKQQELQQLAASHISVSQWANKVDIGSDMSIKSFATEAHQKFCAGLPDSMLALSDGSKMLPGQFRHRNVSVGRHVAPDHESVDSFMSRIDDIYTPLMLKAEKGGLNKLEAIVGVIIAHHRLAWVHPFLDGNGRVSRIILDAMLKKSGVRSVGMWSMSRGLAKSDKEYKLRLSSADEPRMGDLDGRGNLSERRVVEFCEFALGVAKDQIDYMSQMFSVDKIEQRCKNYFGVAQDSLRGEAESLYVHAFQRGEFDRGEAERITGLGERTARDLLRDMVVEGFLISDTPKGRVRAGFPLKALGSLFPNLYPAGDIDANRVHPKRPRG